MLGVTNGGFGGKHTWVADIYGYSRNLPVMAGENPTLGIEYYSKRKLLARYNPLLGYVKSPYYLWQVRVLGFLALLASFVLVVTLIGQLVRIFRG